MKKLVCLISFISILNVSAGLESMGSDAFYFIDTNSGNSVGVLAPDLSSSSSYTLTLPSQDGAANEVLKTDGAGNLSWASVGGSTPPDSMIRCNDAGSPSHGGTSSGDFAIRNFNSCTTTGSDIEYHAKTSTSADYFEIKHDGVYSITYTDINTSGILVLGISKNATPSERGASIGSLSNDDRRLNLIEDNSGYWKNVTMTLQLSEDDLIRAHTNGYANGSGSVVQFVITQVAKQ